MGSWSGLSAAAAVLCAAPFAWSQPAGEDDNTVVLIADRITNNEETNEQIAEGNVEAVYRDRVLRADRLIYNAVTGKVRAIGNVSIVDADGTQRFADEVEVDQNLSDGYAIGFSTRLPDGGVLAANSAVRQSDGINALDQAIFTSCEVCEETGQRPTWSLRARRAVLDQEAQTISYRDAVLEVAGLPVFYIPYFFHPDPTSGKRSGLLPPNLGISTRLGFFYGQPYYRVLSPSSDLTITPTVYTNVRPLLGLEYRKRFHRGSFEVDGSYTFEREVDNDGDRFGDEASRWHVFGEGLFNAGENWQVGFGVERASDDLFTQIYNIQGEGRRRGLFDGQPRTLLSQVFAVGQTENFYADASTLVFQNLQGIDDETIPIATPYGSIERLFDFGAYGRTSLSASSAILNREIGADSRRVSAGGDWRASRVLPGGVLFEPFADARVDYYNLDEEVSGDGDEVRGVASVGAHLSYPFIRRGRRADVVIEPQVVGAFGFSNANDLDRPVEDDILYEFDEGSLFDSNGFGSFDLYEGDGRLSAGFSSTVLFKGGARLNATGGRRWRTRADENFDIASNLDGTSSDWVAAFAADFGRRFRAEARLRLDDDDFSVNRLEAQVQTNWRRFRGQIRYFRIDDSIRPDEPEDDEGLIGNAEVLFTRNYGANFQITRDIVGDTNLAQTVGVFYQDNCSRFEIAYRRTEFVDRDLGPEDQVLFRFSFKGLGDVGNQDLVSR